MGIYPLTNLRFLEFHNSGELNHKVVESVKDLAHSNGVSKMRPTRLAAAKANEALKDCI